MLCKQIFKINSFREIGCVIFGVFSERGCYKENLLQISLKSEAGPFLALGAPPSLIEQLMRRSKEEKSY